MRLNAETIEKLLLEGYHLKSSMAPIKGLLDLFKDKWSFLILNHLVNKSQFRFGELQKKLPSISNKVLSKSLLHLEKNRLIQRLEYVEFPLRVEYRSTAQGKKFFKHLVDLIDCFLKKQTFPK